MYSILSLMVGRASLEYPPASIDTFARAACGGTIAVDKAW